MKPKDIKHAKLIRGLIAGKTAQQSALEAGYGKGVNKQAAGVQACKELKKPEVQAMLLKALDKAGATIEKSAKVLADAHDANEVKVFNSDTGIEYSKPLVDHVTRLKAAELNGRFRGLLSNKNDERDSPLVSIGFFMMKGAAERGLTEYQS